MKNNKAAILFWVLAGAQVLFFFLFTYYSIKASELFDYKSGAGDLEAAQPFSKIAIQFSWAWLISSGALFIACFLKELRNFYFFSILGFIISLQLIGFILL